MEPTRFCCRILRWNSRRVHQAAAYHRVTHNVEQYARAVCVIIDRVKLSRAALALRGDSDFNSHAQGETAAV